MIFYCNRLLRNKSGEPIDFIYNLFFIIISYDLLSKQNLFASSITIKQYINFK